MEIHEGTPEQVAELILRLPEFSEKTSSGEIKERLANPDAQIFVATADENASGFLVSYAETNEVYYNWIMGVLPAHRRLGIAGMLMDVFETHICNKAYARNRVRTMNKHRSMLGLLIRRGYDITSFAEPKITFEKPAQQNQDQ